MDQLPRLGKRELICLLLFTCNHVVSVWRGFLFLMMLGMGYVILLWHSLSLPYNYILETRELILYRQRKTKALIRMMSLLGCAAEIETLFFADAKGRFSHCAAHILLVLHCILCFELICMTGEHG